MVENLLSNSNEIIRLNLYLMARSFSKGKGYKTIEGFFKAIRAEKTTLR